ncbi:hypothetical protein BD779DRAFT_1473197 [Infundibulicybe gibba]|nr:hypothetical protein BD779DRAFT_1473197 [Infundibulicybe gibba]
MWDHEAEYFALHRAARHGYRLKSLRQTEYSAICGQVQGLYSDAYNPGYPAWFGGRENETELGNRIPAGPNMRDISHVVFAVYLLAQGNLFPGRGPSIIPVSIQLQLGAKERPLAGWNYVWSPSSNISSLSEHDEWNGSWKTKYFRKRVRMPIVAHLGALSEFPKLPCGNQNFEDHRILGFSFHWGREAKGQTIWLTAKMLWTPGGELGGGGGPGMVRMCTKHRFGVWAQKRRVLP